MEQIRRPTRRLRVLASRGRSASPLTADVRQNGDAMRSTCLLLLLLVSVPTIAISSTPPKSVRLKLASSNDIVTCTINDRSASRDYLNSILPKLAAIDPNQTIVIEVEGNTPTRELMDLLAICRDKGLTTFRIFILNNGRTMEISAQSETNASPTEIIFSECDGKI